ncbi:MAG: dioxygenase [Candidatus Eisenbacteria bacterium]|uniref:Dioxygenase n=1 Tax=Eiseniibacteriota bacterium TaxID=2212470 RepID=A0A956LY30_UNCEI|nr:dioxygenase [Candidatus Eisenbacteria bacterium]
MPVVFLAHGSPFLLDDATWVRELAGWSAALPRPRAILMVSAHWENQPVTLGATETVPLVYDFYGFPARYYEVTYPAPGAPELAARTRDLLVGSGTTRSVLDAPTRGLDHGAYVPLVAMYPRADVPVLQMSLPTLDAPELFALGRALESLRDEGVLIVGSGFVTHNLRTLDLRPDAPTPAWAADFDAWVTQALETTDVDALVRYRELAPGVRQSLPTHEHFVPLVVASGAAGSDRAVVDFPITGWMAGSFTRRSVQFG